MKYLILLTIPLLMACPGQGPTVKIYQSQPSKGGAVRLQNNEFVPYAQTDKWIMMTTSDAEALLNYCLNPSDSDSTKTEIHNKVLEYTATNE